MSGTQQLIRKKYSIIVIGALVLVILTSGCVSGPSPFSPVVTPPVPPSTVVPATIVYTTVPQVTPTLPVTPSPTIRPLTSDDIKTHFMDLAFGRETSRISRMIPWEISTGTSSNSDRELLERFILEFNDISRSGKISENLRDGTTGDLKIKFIPQDGMNDIADYDKIFKSGDIITAKIRSDTIYINHNLKGDMRNHTILRSVYYIMGVKGDTITYPDSLFYYDDNTNTRLTLIDKKALELLFGGGLYNGMSVDDVKKVIYIK
jgi:hypothetical protein